MRISVNSQLLPDPTMCTYILAIHRRHSTISYSLIIPKLDRSYLVLPAHTERWVQPVLPARAVLQDIMARLDPRDRPVNRGIPVARVRLDKDFLFLRLLIALQIFQIIRLTHFWDNLRLPSWANCLYSAEMNLVLRSTRLHTILELLTTLLGQLGRLDCRGSQEPPQIRDRPVRWVWLVRADTRARLEFRGYRELRQTRVQLDLKGIKETRVTPDSVLKYLQQSPLMQICRIWVYCTQALDLPHRLMRLANLYWCMAEIYFCT